MVGKQVVLPLLECGVVFGLLAGFCFAFERFQDEIRETWIVQNAVKLAAHALLINITAFRSTVFHNGKRFGFLSVGRGGLSHVDLISCKQ